MEDPKADNKQDRPEDRRQESDSDNASREAQTKQRDDGKDSTRSWGLDKAQGVVDAHFGPVAFIREGVDADAASMHDSIVPNPVQMGGIMEPKTKDEITLAAMKNHSPEYLNAMNESYRQQYGHDMLDDMKANMTPDAYRRAQAILNGETDPGYLSPTKKNSEDALNTFKASNGRPLSDYIDAEQLAAIQRNEAVKRGVHDDLGVGQTHGPAQMSDANVKQLRELYPEQLKDADPNTVEGAQKFVAAFNAHEVDQFNNGYYGKEAQDMANSPEKREKFERIQKEWDEAVARDDKDATRKLLTDRYNGGNPKQIQEVEAQRGQTPTGSGLRDMGNDAAYAAEKIWKFVKWAAIPA
jgi:hypothetical protein